MTPPIQFYAQGVPKGQPRVKACIRGKHAGVYTPATADDWREQIYLQGKGLTPSAPMECAIWLELHFYFPRPKSHYRTGKRSAEMRDSAPVWHSVKPDIDNALKLVADQLTVMRFWKDDAQVVRTGVVKRYENGQGPGCLITIREA